jgi:hypothetical protein
MRIIYLDVKATHEDPLGSMMAPCPANRYVPQPNGGWVCLDCGRQVLLAGIEVEPVAAKKPRRLETALKAKQPE